MAAVGRAAGRLWETLDKSRARITTSSMFIPSRSVDKAQVTTRSHQWMLESGFIRQSCSGVYHLLPLAYRVLDNIVSLVEHEMTGVGGARMVAPILTPSALWKRSGRWDEAGSELFRLSDQGNNQFCLGPTHEEPFTELVQQEITSYRQLPLKLYQIERKFRDEKRPRHGLLRAREFLMKDMYSFDVTEELAQTAYDSVCSAYERLFERLCLPVQKVQAHTGNIGGSSSHEYHVISPIGEDTIYACQRCGCGTNSELTNEMPASLQQCPQNSNACPLEKKRAIEIAHAFLLGTKYSAVFNASVFVDNKEKMLQMGCYGIGITRLLQALVEHTLTVNEGRMLWPRSVAPFSVCIVPLASTEDSMLIQRAHQLYDGLQEQLCGDVILEDRLHLSSTKRLHHMELLGYPVTIVLGQKLPSGHVEVHYQSGSQTAVEIVPDSDVAAKTIHKLSELQI